MRDPAHQILDDFDLAFLSGATLFEYRLSRKMRQAIRKPKKVRTSADEAIRIAGFAGTLPHTSFRTKLDNELISPKPIDYSRNPR